MKTSKRFGNLEIRYEVKRSRECKNDKEVCFYLKSKDNEEKKGRRTIGSIILQHVQKDCDSFKICRYITHSRLCYTYHNKKIGIWMYLTAIRYCKRNNIKVTSSNSPSHYAQRIWKSKGLNKYFPVKYSKHLECYVPTIIKNVKKSKSSIRPSSRARKK